MVGAIQTMGFSITAIPTGAIPEETTSKEKAMLMAGCGTAMARSAPHTAMAGRMIQTGDGMVHTIGESITTDPLIIRGLAIERAFPLQDGPRLRRQGPSAITPVRFAGGNGPREIEPRCA